VVAGNRKPATGAHERYALAGVRPVAYYVAQTQNLVNAAITFNIAQYRRQGSRVSVNVGQQGITHG
jgi:hypothetical protein